MPTIDELLPVRLQPRSLRFGDEAQGPAQILHAELSRVAAEADTLLSEIAVQSFHLDSLARQAAGSDGVDVALAEGLAVVSANVREILEQRSVEPKNLTGAPFDDSVNEMAVVRAHSSNSELEGPTVVHTEAPAVLRHGRLISEGAILVESPPQEDP